MPSVVAADVVTDNRSHPEVAILLLEHGVDVHVEKPLAVNIADATHIVEAAERAGKVLAVGENNRHDPLNRLLVHLISSGIVGAPEFVAQSSGTGRSVVASPWRHSWAQGGLALDVGIHIGYILDSMVGPIDSIGATARRALDRRLWTGSDGEEREVAVESDDIYSAYFRCSGGTLGTWSMNFATSPGSATWQRTVWGELGSIDAPRDRSGEALRLNLGDKTLVGEEVKSVVPDFQLSEIEAKLFGGTPFAYRFDPEITDRKLLAAELLDFLGAVRQRAQPEVTGKVGLRSLAVIFTLLESAYVGLPVRVDDVLQGRVHAFQDRRTRG
jgi:predicted dehydrogenase